MLAFHSMSVVGWLQLWAPPEKDMTSSMLGLFSTMRCSSYTQTKVGIPHTGTRCTPSKHRSTTVVFTYRVNIRLQLLVVSVSFLDARPELRLLHALDLFRAVRIVLLQPWKS
jgi:hypothetical protein